MTGNLAPSAIDVITFEISKTLEQEFKDGTTFFTKIPKTVIQRITYRIFPLKSITNYIVWDYKLPGFIDYIATDTSFLDCNNFDGAEELIDRIVLESFEKFSKEFDVQLRKKNIKVNTRPPKPAQSMLLNYRNRLIEKLRTEDWDQYKR